MLPASVMQRHWRVYPALLVFVLAMVPALLGWQVPQSARVPPGARVYVAPIEGGFESYVIAGIHKKKVPLVVVTEREQAEFEISGISESEKAGWAKMLLLGSSQSNEQASIKLTDLRSGAVIWAYSVHKTNSVRGKQSAGEACAKHLRSRMEGKE